MHFVPLFIGSLAALWLARMCLRWRRHIAQAKATGLPYLIAPLLLSWQFQSLLDAAWAPLVKCLPKRYWQHWLGKITPNYFLHSRYEWFDEVGADTVVVATPWRVELYTCNAEVISQVATRRAPFSKNLENYSMLSQFGQNVVTTEGPEWRAHRKATAPSFNEKNTGLVFYESIRQVRGMLARWAEISREKGGPPVTTMEEDTMRFALKIITFVGFGVRIAGPGEDRPEGVDEELAKYGSAEPCEGHELSLFGSLEALMDNVLLLVLLPRRLLPYLPFARTRRALQGRDEAFRYMEELLDERIQRIKSGAAPGETMNIMGHLARTSYTKDGAAGGVLGREDILANAFIMFLAGHETTARAINFALIMLAMNPSSQRRLQRDVDGLVGGQAPEAWDYDALVGPMTASMLSACMHETLRLMPPVIAIPKMVSHPGGLAVTRDGADFALPEACPIALVTVGAHTNPRYWPAEPSKVRPGHDDLLDFVPERWFRKTLKAARQDDDDDDDDSEDGPRGSHTHETLFRPERGAYLPFSDGDRSCLGRRFAEVEFVAALAVLFRRYSVELAVDAWLPEGEALEDLGREARRALYGRARDEAEATLRTARVTVTPRLARNVPMRLVERGAEQFVSWI